MSEDRKTEVQFHRFVNNEQVKPERLLEYHWKITPTDLSGKHILVISDTSTLSFAPDAQREFLGYIDSKTKKDGFDVHPALLMDAANGACYGLGGMTTYRNLHQKEAGKTHHATKLASGYSAKSFEENERYKWFAAPQQAITNCAGAERYTLLGDRESDIYELMVHTLEQGWEFLYRCRCNRKVEGAHQKLYATLDTWEVQHRYVLDVEATQKRTAHQATLAVKFGTVILERPKRHPNKELPKTIQIQVVEIKEDPNTVVGSEAPIHWILLTSHPVPTIQHALTIIQWYCWRWTIEQFFRTAKSKGLDIEQAELKTFHGLANLVTIALLAAVQIIQLVQARNGQTQQELKDCFTPQEQECLMALNSTLEGATEKQKNPHQPHSLAFGAWIIARLGGWKGYASEQPPGPITMTKGLSQFYAITKGYYLRI